MSHKFRVEIDHPYNVQGGLLRARRLIPQAKPAQCKQCKTLRATRRGLRIFDKDRGTPQHLFLTVPRSFWLEIRLQYLQTSTVPPGHSSYLSRTGPRPQCPRKLQLLRQRSMMASVMLSTVVLGSKNLPPRRLEWRNLQSLMDRVVRLGRRASRLSRLSMSVSHFFHHA